MTTTPPDSTTTKLDPDEGPRVTRDEVRDLARLRRTTKPERTIAGVAGGLGRHLDVDPVILRVAFVVLAFFGGAGIVLYAACWLLVPDDASTKAPLGLDERSRTVGLVIAGGIAAVTLLGSALGDGFVPVPLVIAGGIVLLVVLQVNKRKASPPRPAKVDTRRQGPVLFWFTLALCALGIGLLGTLDLAGVPMAGPAYAALVVGIVGTMLVLGAFWGRAGGLILVGLVAVLALVAGTAAQQIDGNRVLVVPTSAAEVQATYTMDAGELVLDLRQVQDPPSLLGRTVRLTGHVGRIRVIVPEGLEVAAAATVDGPGRIDVFGTFNGGVGQSMSTGVEDSSAVLSIDATLDAGAIQFTADGPAS